MAANLPQCTNSSSIQASFTSDAGLAAVPGGSSPGPSGTGTSAPTGSGSGSSSTPTPTRNAAPGLVGDSAPLVNAAMAMGFGLMGAALLL